MKITPTNKWVYSNDEEWWTSDQYPTKQEAIKAGLEEYPYGCYVGSCYNIEFTYDDMDFSEYVIEKLGECVDDEVGDGSQYENYLAKAIMKWIENCQLQPNQYVVNNIEWVEGECKDGCC